MRQAFRRYAFPMMIIAAVLAAALSLNCFAAERVYSTNDFASTILGIYGFPYLSIPALNLTVSGETFRLYSLVSSSNEISYSASCLVFPSYNYEIPVSAKFTVPLYLNDISSFNLSFFVGIVGFPPSDTSFDSYNDLLNIDAAILSTPNESIDLTVSPGLDVKFTEYEDAGEYTILLRKYNVSFSSSSLFDINFLELFFSIPDYTQLPSDFGIIFGISDESSLSAVTDGSSSIIKSLETMARLLESFIAAEIQTDLQILDKLDDIIDYFTSNGSSGGESEDILADGEEKQQELEQLGDALSNVPKPSIQNITQSFDPADTLISADPGMVQNALSIVYSWDKFLILLGLFIAVGTISYIIFGKKS